MNYELMLAVTILAAMGAGFAWLSHQVQDEPKTDIKRVEEKLDNKERSRSNWCFDSLCHRNEQ